MKFCIECEVNPLDGWKKKFCCKVCKQKWYDRKIKTEKKVAEVTFPHYTCQHCGHKHHLDFDPKKPHNAPKWNYFKCEKCAKARVDFRDIDKSCENATIQPSNK